MPSGCTNNFPKSGRGLDHVTPTIFGSTVGYPSDSLASCYTFDYWRSRYRRYTTNSNPHLCNVTMLLSPFDRNTSTNVPITAVLPQPPILVSILSCTTRSFSMPAVCDSLIGPMFVWSVFERVDRMSGDELFQILITPAHNWMNTTSTVFCFKCKICLELYIKLNWIIFLTSLIISPEICLYFKVKSFSSCSRLVQKLWGKLLWVNSTVHSPLNTVAVTWQAGYYTVDKPRDVAAWSLDTQELYG